MVRQVILGGQVDGLTMEEALDAITGFIQSGTPHQVITLNAEILYRAQSEPELMRVINSAHLVTADGAGIVWAGRRLGRTLPERVTGIDLMLALAGRAAKEGWRIFLYGAAPGVAEEAAAKLLRRHPGLKVAGTAHGYLSEEEQRQLADRIRQTKPDILFAALGAPKQDYWISKHLDELQVPVCIGVGGSFDVIAGRVQRAPGWVQSLNLEWLYRLLTEPKRIKRALVLPKFVLLVLRQQH